jgi:HK97 family phage major capsid protein
VVEEEAKFTLNNYFNKIIVNDIGANIILEISNTDAVWRKELTDVESKNQKINKITINLNELVSYKVFSRKFMYLNQFDVKKNIYKSVEANFINKLNEGILFGDGINEPKGILNY